MVASSGNNSDTTVSYPAAYRGVVAVGAVDVANDLAWYSNTGAALDLVAPGGDTGVDLNRDGLADGVFQETIEDGDWGYHLMQGTSMAAPHVAAAAALLMSAGATAEEAEQHLGDTALDLGASGWDSRYGDGMIQPAAALRAFLDDARADDCSSAYWYTWYGHYYTYYAEYLSNLALSADAEYYTWYTEYYLDVALSYATDARTDTYNVITYNPADYARDAYSNVWYSWYYDYNSALWADYAYDTTGGSYSYYTERYASYGRDYLSTASSYAYSCYVNPLTR